jgi:branched-chain amino acid transport system substrate-binding protein
MKNQNRREFLKTMGAGAGVLVCGALGAGDAMAAEKTAQKMAKIKDKIKIGHIAIFSGPYGTYGELQQRGSKLAEEEIKKAGGIMGADVEVIYGDSKGKPDEAIKQARRLVESEGVDFLIGIDSSGVVLGISDVMPELKRLLFVTHAATHKLTEEKVYKEGNRNVFRLATNVYQDGIMAGIVATHMPAKRWACIHPDYSYGYDSWDLFKKSLKKLRPDVEFVGEAWAKSGTTDFKPLISAILDKKPEGIHSVQWGPSLITFVRQAIEMGLFDAVKYKGGYAFVNPMGSSIDVMEALAKEYPEGAWISGRYIWSYPPTPINSHFVKAHFDKWKHLPAYSGATSYTAMYLIKKLVEATGTLDIKTHIDFLEDLTIYCPLGTVRIRKEDHQAMYDVPFGQVKRDPNFPIPVLTNLISAPADLYFRKPPFDDVPPYTGYPPFVKI